MLQPLHPIPHVTVHTAAPAPVCSLPQYQEAIRVTVQFPRAR
jgi:hypothetical protein